MADISAPYNNNVITSIQQYSFTPRHFFLNLKADQAVKIIHIELNVILIVRSFRSGHVIVQYRLLPLGGAADLTFEYVRLPACFPYFLPFFFPAFLRFFVCLPSFLLSFVCVPSFLPDLFSSCLPSILLVTFLWLLSSCTSSLFPYVLSPFLLS